MAGITPILHRSAKVHECSFLYATGDLCDEWVVLTLGCIESFVEVLPRRPGHPVRAAEPVRCNAEVVDEARDADGAAAILFLSGGETHRHGVTSRHPTLWTG